MKHTIQKLRAGDYVYRGHRITQSELIHQQDNLTCQYDWQPMWSWRNGYTGWYISVEPFVKTNELDSIIGKDKWPPEYYNVGCTYEHENYDRKGCMRMIDNHIDKTDELEIKLGLSGRLLTGAELDTLSTARTEAREVAERDERYSKGAAKTDEIYSAIFDTLSADDMQGMAFCETTEALMKTLKGKGLLNHEVYYVID